MTEGRDIPWLQDRTDVQLWEAWTINYRDVLLFNEDLILQETINLSQFNLTLPENQQALLDKMIAL